MENKFLPKGLTEEYDVDECYGRPFPHGTILNAFPYYPDLKWAVKGKLDTRERRIVVVAFHGLVDEPLVVATWFIGDDYWTWGHYDFRDYSKAVQFALGKSLGLGSDKLAKWEAFA